MAGFHEQSFTIVRCFWGAQEIPQKGRCDPNSLKHIGASMMFYAMLIMISSLNNKYFTSSDPHRDIYAIHTAFYV